MAEENQKLSASSSVSPALSNTLGIRGNPATHRNRHSMFLYIDLSCVFLMQDASKHHVPVLQLITDFYKRPRM